MDYDRLGLSFNTKREINKNDFDSSTFDLIDRKQFHNTNFGTVMSYILEIVLVILAVALLASDIYTCLNILVFKHWSSSEYQPYAYSVAKWIFTGCIIFQFVLLGYHWIWAIKAYRLKNIALVYVNSIAKTMYTFKSYSYHCLFNKIEQDNFFDWSCFLSYYELDNAAQIILADAPRQVINVLTLRYYATDGDQLNDILSNISDIATTNLKLSIILSFMCLSFIIWCIFFFKFCLGILFYIPVVVNINKRGYKSLKKYCCNIVNNKVRILVKKHHKSPRELMEAGILNSDEIAANPLISHSYTMDSLKKQNYSQQELSRPLQSHFANQAYSQNKNYYNQHQNQLQLLLQKYDNPFESQISLNYDTPPPVRKPPRPSTAPQNANPFESEISLNYENRAPERKALPRPSTGPVERSGPRNNGHMVRKAPTEPQMHSGVAPISEAGATVGPSQSTYGSETGATVGPQEYTSENMPDQARYISDTGATVGPMNPFTEYKANEFHASSDSLVSGISQQQSQHLHQVRLQSQSQTLQPMAVIQLQYPISLASPLEIQYPIKPPSSTILQQLYQPYQPQYQVSEFNEFHENPFDEAESQKLLLIDEYNSPIIPPPRHESIDSTHTQGDQERASYGSYGSLSHSNGSNTSFTFGNINHSTVPLIKEPKTEPKTEPNSSENIPYPIRGSSILDNFDYTSNQKEYEDLNGKSHN